MCDDVDRETRIARTAASALCAAMEDDVLYDDAYEHCGRCGELLLDGISVDCPECGEPLCPNCEGLLCQMCEEM